MGHIYIIKLGENLLQSANIEDWEALTMGKGNDAQKK